LLLVRHGESAGNVALEAAHAAGHVRIDIDGRDAAVALGRRGEQQSTALGRWLAARSVDDRPEIVLCSPYRRARQGMDEARILAIDQQSDVVPGSVVRIS
jgi:phosphohistidine phosphatase SixA